LRFLAAAVVAAGAVLVGGGVCCPKVWPWNGDTLQTGERAWKWWHRPEFSVLVYSLTLEWWQPAEHRNDVGSGGARQYLLPQVCAVGLSGTDLGGSGWYEVPSFWGVHEENVVPAWHSAEDDINEAWTESACDADDDLPNNCCPLTCMTCHCKTQHARKCLAGEAGVVPEVPFQPCTAEADVCACGGYCCVYTDNSSSSDLESCNHPRSPIHSTSANIDVGLAYNWGSNSRHAESTIFQVVSELSNVREFQALLCEVLVDWAAINLGVRELHSQQVIIKAIDLCIMDAQDCISFPDVVIPGTLRHDPVSQGRIDDLLGGLLRSNVTKEFQESRVRRLPYRMGQVMPVEGFPVSGSTDVAGSAHLIPVSFVPAHWGKLAVVTHKENEFSLHEVMADHLPYPV